VYLQSAGQYALATDTTGFDGLVGDIALNRFELVTSGELDRLSGLGLIVNTVYSLSAVAGAVAPGSAYPIYKSLSADTVTLVPGNVGTAGTGAVLGFTISILSIPNGVPQAGADGLLHPGWFPPLPYEAEGAVDAHQLDFRSHDPYLVRSPEGGGILDLQEGSLVFDVDTLTQVIDEAFL